MIDFEFEVGLYPSNPNAWVVGYTQYIVDVSQDILVVLKVVGFNHRPVPYIRVRLSRQEPKVT